MGIIKDNLINIVNELPENVMIVGAAKKKTAEEILEAINAGLKIIGQNYVQEAEQVYSRIQELLAKDIARVNKYFADVKWHFIGHLQKNKVKKIVKIVDLIETVDSYEVAKEIDKECEKIGKQMSVLIEVNSAREDQKFGVFPEEAAGLIKKINGFKNVKIMGLMTMGPLLDSPEDMRPYFRETKQTFEKIATFNLPNVFMKYLSMGMSESYHIAVEEGSNMVRIGTKIFGER